jgi:hypothetical protein
MQRARIEKEQLLLTHEPLRTAPLLAQARFQAAAATDQPDGQITQRPVQSFAQK